MPHFIDIATPAGLTVAHISSVDKGYIIKAVSGGAPLYGRGIGPIVSFL